MTEPARPFGRYELLDRLAVGGMAELFLARDGQTGSLRVIKRILPWLSHEAEFVRMFLDEARIAAQLHHENIVRLFELGKIEDSIFIAMEFVDGADVRKLLRQETKEGRAVPPGVAAWISARVCEGLHSAHNSVGLDGKPLNVVHRDVSPQNVMVALDGRVKLVDFGIARAGAFVEQSRPGMIPGKFLYLSPEQLGAGAVDHRSDLFAVGTLLYEVTTGRSPFHRPTHDAVIRAIQSEEPPAPEELVPRYPRALSRIVMRCLSRSRDHRYQHAGEIAADLDRFIAEHAPTTRADVARYVERTIAAARPQTPKPARQPLDRRGRRSTWWMGAGVAAAALLLGAGGAWLRAASTPAPEAVLVRFGAEPRTTIEGGGVAYLPGRVYQVAPGPLTVTWRCANGKSGTTRFSVEKGPESTRELPISCLPKPAE